MGHLKLGLSGLSSADLVAKSVNLEEKMAGNTNFPTPLPALADLTAARVDLMTWMQKSQYGDRRAAAMRRNKYKILANLIREMARYVSFTANGVDDVILSAGFQLQRQPEPRPPVGIPVALSAKRGPLTGQILLDWKGSSNALNYMVEMSLQNPADSGAEFTSIGITSKSKFTVDGLQEGTKYWFRVKAIGPKNESAWCDPAIVMAA